MNRLVIYYVLVFKNFLSKNKWKGFVGFGVFFNKLERTTTLLSLKFLSSSHGVGLGSNFFFKIDRKLSSPKRSFIYVQNVKK